MEEWYRWINKKPTVKVSNGRREEGWLTELPLNYFLFAKGFPSFSFSFFRFPLSSFL